MTIIVTGGAGADAAAQDAKPRAPAEIACCACVALAVAAMAAGGIQAFFFYRCPACRGSLLWYRGLYPAHCPHCGKPL